MRAPQRTPAVHSRRVTLPREAVQPLTWAQRRERFRHVPAQPPTRTRLVQRTLAQTGRAAPAGQTRRSRPLARRRVSSPVPARSRQMQRGPRLWHKVLGFFTLLAIAGGGIGFALIGPTFHVQQLSIEGTENQGLIETIRQMGIEGQNIFLLNQPALVAHLEALPLVASAGLGLQLPSRVVVAIRERVPVLLWQTGSAIFGVAHDGVVIAPLSQLSGAQRLALVVDQRQGAPLHPGTRLRAADVLFVEQLFARLPGIAGVSPFTLLYVHTLKEGGQSVPANQAGSGSYIVVSASGWQAYLGDAQNRTSLANRLQELQQILSIARQRRLQIATIDLRFGSRPAYTLRPQQ
ncbi:MAG TPA: FtsQ-type POTRA domain-containing protein [Ktedonobacteraceae bacterium]